MKKLLTALMSLALLAGAQSVQAGDFLTDAMVASIQPMDVINWKVGDTANYDVTLLMPGGKMVKSVTKEENGAVWMVQDMTVMGQKQKVETLINRADAKILKLIVNGQEQQVKDEHPEIISQEYTEITVKAGTFKVLHVTGKMDSAPKFEMWANPVDIAMEGTAKMVASTQFGIDMTMELTSFTKLP